MQRIRRFAFPGGIMGLFGLLAVFISSGGSSISARVSEYPTQEMSSCVPITTVGISHKPIANECSTLSTAVTVAVTMPTTHFVNCCHGVLN